MRFLALLLTLLATAPADAGTSVTFNGSSYTVPAVGDASWGANVSTYLIAISTGSLQKSGGTFTLTNEVDTGATYGIKMPYLKTETTVPATAGFVRAAKTDTIDWRNNANGGNLALGINGSDRLLFNSIVVPGISTTDTLTNKTMDGGSNTFTNLPAATGLTGVVPAANGGTGIANNAASTLAISGSFATTLTVTGSTGVTLPTAGTLATLAGTEALTNKTVNKVALTAPASGSTLTIADGKGLTASNTLTLTGTDGSSVAFGAGGTVVFTGRNISTTAPITGGGDLSADRTIALPVATGTAHGYLSSADWTAFNSIARVTATGSVPGYLAAADWTAFNSVARVAATTSVPGYLVAADWTAFNGIARVKATSTLNGYLSSTDWTTFNSGVTGVQSASNANGYLSSTDWTAFNGIARVKATSTLNGYLSSTDWTQFNGLANTSSRGTVSYEDTGTFTATFAAGPCSSGSQTLKYSRVGKAVVIECPGWTCTSSSSSNWTASTVVAAALRPSIDVYTFAAIQSNGSTLSTPGYIKVASTGDITIFGNATGGSVAATGAAGPVNGFVISYTIQ